MTAARTPPREIASRTRAEAQERCANEMARQRPDDPGIHWTDTAACRDCLDEAFAAAIEQARKEALEEMDSRHHRPRARRKPMSVNMPRKFFVHPWFNGIFWVLDQCKRPCEACKDNKEGIDISERVFVTVSKKRAATKEEK